jgi:outer membrane protein assembly factor BamB
MLKRTRTRGLALAAAALAGAGCWPATGAGPDRAAYNVFETALTAASAPSLVEAWTAATDAGPRGVSSPVVSPDGLVHVTTESSVYGIEVQTGAVRWVESPHAGTTGVAMDTELSLGPPTGDGTLYISIGHGATGWENAVFDTRDGSWISEFFGRQEGIRGDGIGTLGAFSTFENRGSGVRQGLSTIAGVVDVEVTDHPGDSRLTVGHDLVFHAGSGLMTTERGDGTEGNGLRAFPYSGLSDECGAPGDAVFACPAWVTPLDGTSATTPVLSPDGSTVYVGTDAGTFSAVDAATGAVRWAAQVGSAVVAPPAVAPDAVLVPTVAGSLVALAPDGCGAETCGPVWSSAGGSPLRVQPGAATDVVVGGAEDGTVSAFATAGCGASTCAALWSDRTGSAITGAPAISLGRVLVGTADGRLIAYGLPPV